MPATTRNGAKQKRTHVDDPSETKAAVTSSKRRSSSINDTPRKRAAQPNHVQNSKAQDPSQKDISPPVEDESRSDQSKDEILINRAPVLELWAATVTSFLYPEVSWETSLSAGSAISTLCAISKGRTIGTIDKKDPATAGKQQRSKGDQLEDLEVMGLHLKLKDGHVLVGDKPKKANEQTLIKKFGEASYEHVKETFQNSLQLWSGQEDELNAQAFHHYEVFRPTVPKGQKGWGRKGNLNLQTVKDAVSPD